MTKGRVKEPYKAAADSHDACANPLPCPCQNATNVPADGWKGMDEDKRKGWVDGGRAGEGVMDGSQAESA